MTPSVQRGAIIYGDHRLLLWRHIYPAHPIAIRTLWVMLNPSTADDRVDDPTVRKCLGFCRQWREDGLMIANLYTLRTPSPALLKRTPAPDRLTWQMVSHLESAITSCNRVVYGWGSKVDEIDDGHERVRAVRSIVERQRVPYCLGTTKSGQPRHPLYLPYATELVQFDRRPG